MNSRPRRLAGSDRPTGRKLRGVSLIEILIVMSIIALLIAIFVPAVVRAKRQAQRTICKAYQYNFYRSDACRAAQIKLEAFDCGCYGELGKGLDAFKIPPDVTEEAFRQELEADVVESCRSGPRPGG